MSQPVQFEEHLRQVLHQLRSSLLDLLTSVGADHGRPQDMARRFGLNKNLTWKVSKIVNAHDVVGVVPVLPGPAAFKLLLEAMSRHGASERSVAAVRDALDAFDRMVETHSGDRGTLDLMASSLAPPQVQTERLEQSRKLAFQGNSATWGVQAQTQVALSILAPSATPGFVDLAQVGGLVGFRRLRPGVTWPLFRREAFDQNESAPVDDEAIDPSFGGPEQVPLIGAFCSSPTPRLEVLRTGNDVHYLLPRGPIGNVGALTCIFGTIARAAGPSDDEAAGEFCELGGNLMTPVEVAVLDLLVHRDLGWAMTPEAALVSRLDGNPLHAGVTRERSRLPIDETVHGLGRGAAAVATPHVPDYPNLVRTAMARAGWDADDFMGFRLVIPYPPIPTAAFLRCPLPVRSRQPHTRQPVQ